MATETLSWGSEWRWWGGGIRASSSPILPSFLPISYSCGWQFGKKSQTNVPFSGVLWRSIRQRVPLPINFSVDQWFGQYMVLDKISMFYFIALWKWPWRTTVYNSQGKKTKSIWQPSGHLLTTDHFCYFLGETFPYMLFFPPELHILSSLPACL